MKGLSLFAGVGLFDRAFENVGLNITNAIEINDKAVLSYNKNNKLQITAKDIKHFIPEEHYDFIIAGFPCPSFSKANPNAKGLEDQRGQLFFELVRVIRQVKPAFFCLENVDNLLTIDNGKTFAVIAQELESSGYFIKTKVLSPHTHGNIPALRNRLFIVGFDNKEHYEAFDFPEQIDLTCSVFDLLDDKAEEKFYYVEGDKHYPTCSPAVKGRVYQLRRTYLRENKKALLPTITHTIGTGGNNNVPIIRDDYGVRKITPEELFRFQGANNFIVPKANSTAYQQVGNAVCVSVVERIAKAIKQTIDKNNLSVER